VGVVTGLDLAGVRLADADYEESDGSTAVMDVDLLGEPKEHGRSYPTGPIAALAGGTSLVRVW
jgi:hypothetical protein